MVLQTIRLVKNVENGKIITSFDTLKGIILYLYTQNQIVAWRVGPSDDGRKGAQIDMLIDRADNLVNICEMKFSHNEYTVTKDDADSLHHKAERFIAETGCKKSVSLTMVTVSGIAHTGYWSEIHNSITSEDLFKA